MDGIAPTPRRLFEEPFDGVKNNQETEEKLRKPSTHSYEVETKMVERKAKSTIAVVLFPPRFLLLANEILLEQSSSPMEPCVKLYPTKP
ncbi:hypothetical protein APICC_00314 [Apis cerana cerana]|uniref:Uncharacterized protein n=1 Tax=Apis cerana cerana TaxID=94128 RepID=A0A2A3ED42_APICC|nr:hypothetical protein APICC_00314 [Apis cerana cerana]